MAEQSKRITSREYAVGENHANARVSEDDVELIRRLRESPDRLSYSQIAAKMDNYDPPLAKETIRDICTYRRRGRAG